MIQNIRRLAIFSFGKQILKAATSYFRRFIFHPLFSIVTFFRGVIYRAVGEWFCGLDSYFLKVSRYLLDKARGNSPSKIMRPWFEYQYVRVIFGINLIAALFIVGFTSAPASATFPSGIDVYSEQDLEISVVEAPKNVVVATERRLQMPVELIGASQGFHKYHPGVDLRAPYGSDIRSITDGVVSDVFRSRYGYGQAVIVEHADGYSSMYAHVQRISVESGSSIDQETVIAKIGMTGYTTGPHLHLEIYKEGMAVNPRPLIGY